MRKSRLEGLRQSVDEFAEAGGTLEDITKTIINAASGLDAERRAVLWLYARSRTEAARAPGGGGAAMAADGGRVHASGRPSEPGPAREREGDEMPYVRCPNCGLTTYAPRTQARTGHCPGCGEPLRVDGRDEASSEPGGIGVVPGVLALAREQLDMDVALLTAVEEGQEVVLEAAGEWPPIGSLKGGSIPFEETFCNRLLEGRISNVVGDAAEDERVRDLEMARVFGVGAWIGVPLTLSDARLYVLCCLAREARPALGDDEVRLMRDLAESVLVELEGSTT